jgi:Ca2+-binding RTX toxin-like protein
LAECRAGADTLKGGDGNDTYGVDNAGDVVAKTNASATQIDTVQSWVNYTLGANLENLQLLGAGNLNGIANSLQGNSARQQRRQRTERRGRGRHLRIRHAHER